MKKKWNPPLGFPSVRAQRNLLSLDSANLFLQNKAFFCYDVIPYQMTSYALPSWIRLYEFNYLVPKKNNLKDLALKSYLHWRNLKKLF